MDGFGNQFAVRVEEIPFATVFSPDADVIKLYVRALAYHYQPEVVVLNVVDLGSPDEDPDANLPVTTYRVCEEKYLLETAGNQKIPPVAKLRATEPESNLLVIGTRGPRDLSRMVLGSTTQEYLYQSGMPVLSVGPGVPHPQQPMRFQSIVYATDYSAEAAKACASAFSFAQYFGGQVYVCHVLPDPESGCDLDGEDLNDRFIGTLEGLVPEVSPEWADPECVLDHKYAGDGILLVARRVNASLIVLATRRAQRRSIISTTGLAFQVVSGSSCPVLTIQG
jgi:nucleotide-binding universal stress UspA family protein